MSGRGDCSACPARVDGHPCAAEASDSRPYPVWRYCELVRLNPARWTPEVRRLTTGEPTAPAPTPAQEPPAPRRERDPWRPLLAVWECPYRVPLDPLEAQQCGCGGSGMAYCLLGKATHSDGRVGQDQCLRCVRER